MTPNDPITLANPWADTFFANATCAFGPRVYRTPLFANGTKFWVFDIAPRSADEQYTWEVVCQFEAAHEQHTAAAIAEAYEQGRLTGLSEGSDTGYEAGYADAVVSVRKAWGN